jgi:hypothetical protein
VKRVLVFGATGFLGSSCVNELNGQGWQVISFGRDLDKLNEIDQISAVVWAQGANHTGSILDTKSETWMELWDANVGFIVKGLQILLKGNILVNGWTSRYLDKWRFTRGSRKRNDSQKFVPRSN